MIYRLPCISDEKMLRDYVREYRDHGETSISASLGLTSSDYSEWVERIQRNALTGDKTMTHPHCQSVCVSYGYVEAQLWDKPGP